MNYILSFNGAELVMILESLRKRMQMPLREEDKALIESIKEKINCYEREF